MHAQDKALIRARTRAYVGSRRRARNTVLVQARLAKGVSSLERTNGEAGLWWRSPLPLVLLRVVAPLKV